MYPFSGILRMITSFAMRVGLLALTGQLHLLPILGLPFGLGPMTTTELAQFSPPAVRNCM